MTPTTKQFSHQNRPQTSLVFRRAMHFRNIQPLYRPNPRPQTSSSCRCTRLRKSSWLLSTPKIKLLSILKDRQWSPCDFVETSLHFRQVLSLQFLVRTPPTSLQVSSRKEFDVNWEEVSTAHDWVNWTSSTGSLRNVSNATPFFLIKKKKRNSFFLD